VKIRVLCFLAFALFIMSAASSFADAPVSGTPAPQLSATAKRQPIGVFTNDDGETIVVGVGTTNPLATLDVSRGEVKIGSTGEACTATLAGTLRYAATKLQLCDGTGWRNVSLDKAQ
jgi:hypothetical protein